MASIFYTSGFHVVGDPWGGMVFTFVAPVPKPGPAQDGRNPQPAGTQPQEEVQCGIGMTMAHAKTMAYQLSRYIVEVEGMMGETIKVDSGLTSKMKGFTPEAWDAFWGHRQAGPGIFRPSVDGRPQEGDNVPQRPTEAAPANAAITRSR